MQKRECLLVSRCLLGEPCRYDGVSRPVPAVIALGERFDLISVCPESDGGLPTPRIPSERVGQRVLMRDGTDVTDNYLTGAAIAYRLCLNYGITRAVLKARSPSCGRGRIYDGSFSHTLTDRDGVCAEYLSERGIKIYTEDEVDELIAERD